MMSPMAIFGDYTESKLDWFPDSASTFAEQSDGVFWFITIVCLFFFVGIAGPLFWYSYRYNKKKGEKAESQIDHNTFIEVVWSVGPCFLLIAMFWVGAKGFLDHRTMPEGAYTLNVKAYKWGWGMDYGKGVVHPELHVLVNEPTKLTMRSEDVIHSLYIPAFRVKKDIVPGRYNYMWFQSTKASKKADPEEVKQAVRKWKESGGDWNYDKYQFTPEGYEFYDLYCTEYCGKNHSEMQTVVVVHETQKDLDAWIELKSKRPDGVSKVEYGEKLYLNRGCKTCHSLDGSRLAGPSYKDSYGNLRQFADGGEAVMDENYVRESILYPKAKIVLSYQPAMPSYKGQLSDDDIDCLIEFIKSKNPSAATRSPAESTGGEESAEDSPGESEEQEQAETNDDN